MKRNQIRKHIRGICGLSVLTIAAALLLAGCAGSGTPLGGGGGGGGGGTPNFSAPIAIDSPEPVTFSVTVTGTQATGTLVKAVPPGRQTELIPPGTHTFTGTYNATTGYALAGQLPGGKNVTITGTIPGAGKDGHYKVVIGEDEFEGGLLPTDAPKPTLVPDPDKVGMEPGQKATLTVVPANFPDDGTIQFRWFIAAPAAYFTTVHQSTVNGQDVWVDVDDMVINTTTADAGKLKVHVQAYVVKGGVKTFLANTHAMVELEDVRFVIPTWVHEIGQNPAGGPETNSYLWEFPTYPGAKEYIVTTFHAVTGAETTKHMFTGIDLDKTPITDIPIYVGVSPHSMPPLIDVKEMLTGRPRFYFFRRGSTVRMLVCTCDPEKSQHHRDITPASVKVRM